MLSVNSLTTHVRGSVEVPLGRIVRIVRSSIENVLASAVRGTSCLSASVRRKQARRVRDNVRSSPYNLSICSIATQATSSNLDIVRAYLF
jgi:hypothetical protein